MSSPLAVKTAPLPVSILSGPSAPALFQAFGAIPPQTRIGLLTAEGSDGEVPRPQDLPGFVIERLSSFQGGHGHDPAQLVRQIRIIADGGAVDHLLIECDPATPAIALASLFVPDGSPSESLTDIAQLTSAIVVLDSADLLTALIHRREAKALASPCFIAEQIEFANHIVLVGGQDDSFALARAIVATLNPRARVSKLSSTLALELLNPGGCFDFTAALDGAGWRKLIEGEELPDPNENDRVRTLAYHAWRPFHPERFWNLLHGGTPAIFRAKGFFWLATRMDFVGGLNLAGSECHVAAAGEWWAARDNDVRESEMPERTRKEWREPFGDRRQAIAVMGIDLDPGTIRAQLDACLLTDAEVAAGAESWQSLSDPFPCWSHHHHHHHHGHDQHHECDHGDCCHH